MGKTQPALARTVVYFLSLAALAATATMAAPAPDEPAPGGVAAPAPPGGELSGDSGKIRCPDCNSEGKMPCPTCGGKGELSKPCDICRGTGRKLCPVCIKADKAEPAATPGRVICDYCAGKGALGGKPCPRCDGAQTLQCTSCGGKGSLTCRKTVIDKICPTCKFVGKIPCTTCEGTLLVAPEVVAARRAAAAAAAVAAKKAADAAATPSQGASTPSKGNEKSDQEKEQEIEDEKREESEPAVSFAELEARFGAVKVAYDSHLDVFAVDPRAGLDVERGEALRLSKKLPGATKGDDSTASKIAVWAEKVQRFRSRWTELRSLFDDEHKTFLPVQRLMKTRESRLNDAPKGRRETVDAEVNRQIGIALRVVEKRSGKLVAEDPAWLGRELTDLQAEWGKLKSRGEPEADELAKKAQAEAEKTQLAKKQERETREKDALKARPLVARKPKGPRPAEASYSSKREAEAPAARSEARDAEPTTWVAGEETARPTKKSRSSKSGVEEPVRYGSLFWAVLGAGLASAVIWLVSRSRRSETGEEAPPAVS